MLRVLTMNLVENGTLAKRIDYVWMREALQPHLRELEIVADQPDANGYRASDPAGLLVSLDLEI